MEETEEQRLDREFDELNEGLMGMQIMEWFEKRDPEPHPPTKEINDPDSPAWMLWDQWQQDLVMYADGWKDALKALQERRDMEKEIDIAEREWKHILSVSTDYPADFLTTYQLDLRGYMMAQIATGFDTEDWNYKEE